MWTIISCLIMLWLGTSILVNIIKIVDFIDLRKESVKLAEVYKRFEEEHTGQCEYVGKHTKEEE